MSIGVMKVSSRREMLQPVELARLNAERGVQAARAYLCDPENRSQVEWALRIRAVENGLYDLFGKGKLHGTIHTCIGQEFSGAILGKYFRTGDLVTSNHRCHGHFIGATENWRGLIDELVGNRDGVCAGIGSSQHLWANGFISNGQQGGLVPVGAGVALDRKLKGKGEVAFSFIGEGTLGEGIVYETLNLDALWSLPHVVVCENNYYSQSTPQNQSVSGSISERAAAFGIEAVNIDNWDLSTFDLAMREAVDRARTRSLPTFLVLSTYRLNPHSKGDDIRDKTEIDWFRKHDPATIAVSEFDAFRAQYASYEAEVADYIATSLTKPGLDPAEYFPDQLPRAAKAKHSTWIPAVAQRDDDTRLVQQLNNFYREWLANDKNAFFLGEDIEDPYGGAFKVSKGLSTSFANQVKTTPISEAAITGVGVGLAISGRRPLVEIMFGDFITYAFDQIVNNASKIYHMYNKNISCPVIVRAAMGGRRGYGPTHSQSLERFLIGIDNCCTVAVNSMANVATQLSGLRQLECPVVLLENKSDYTAKTFSPPQGFVVESDGALLPTFRIRAERAKSTVTLFSFGGMARFIANDLLRIFEQADVVPELIVPTALHPLNLLPIIESVQQTGLLAVIEEGASFGSVGGEVIAQLHDQMSEPFRSIRIGGKPAPIPSAPALESAALPSIEDICSAITRLNTGSL
jgi:2-oxoisovalerate dehydrogenase E1 component